MNRLAPLGVGVSLVLVAAAAGNDSFVNWESPHVTPLDATPDGTRLLAVNTADNRLEIFDVSAPVPAPLGAVPVGLDPVSVRALSDSIAWVVNHVSDTVSVVDLNARNVIRTLPAGDEPADVVFAGGRAFVSVSQENHVLVFDLADLDAAPTVLDILGEEPRALATDGTRVFAAIAESGNATTIIPPSVVSSEVNPYEGDPNPPPNDGAGFSPPQEDNPSPPPEVAHIVQRNDQGQWIDDNGGDWSAAVTWDLLDHDVAIIDVATLDVSYQSGLMNMDMAITARPDGHVTVVGLEATNVIRFEPNLNGTFVRSHLAIMSPEGQGAPTIVDLNPHLDYTVPAVTPDLIELSIGDPRAIAWSGDSQTGYVAGMGSNNVIVIDNAGGRIDNIEVGEGPTGLVLDEADNVLYVLDKFEGAISVVDLGAEVAQEIARVPFYDPTPSAIKEGRPFLYDTHLTSGLGQASCASCHVDARQDALAWDLGNPESLFTPFALEFCVGNDCDDWHPMKGPMTTQTLIGSLSDGVGALHWRGDRPTLNEFNVAFEFLLGGQQLLQSDMDKFIAFVETLETPPNPFRNLDNTLPTQHPNGGDPLNGFILFQFGNLALPLNCNNCHKFPTGTDGLGVSGSVVGTAQALKVPHLRNVYEKTGLDFNSLENTRGFGFRHDGSVDTVLSFLSTAPHFTFDAGATGDQQMLDIAAFVDSFATDTHAGVGTQVTLASAQDAADNAALLTTMEDLSAAGDVGLVVKGAFAGEPRGYYMNAPDSYQSDRHAEVVTFAELTSGLAPGAELTFTLVPSGSEVRIGVDRDQDGFFDLDETDVCADPADPTSFPGGPGNADVNLDGEINILDFIAFQALFELGLPEADVNTDGELNILDFIAFQAVFEECV